jgi:hypothetical protein
MPIPSLDQIIAFNRESLSLVPVWIYPDEWVSPPTLFNYGLPRNVFHLINLPQSSDPTEADLLCQLLLHRAATQTTTPLRYLEIGTSVGKNAFQIARFATQFLSAFELHFLDLEKPNPTFANLLSALSGVSPVVQEGCPSQENRFPDNYTSPRGTAPHLKHVWSNGSKTFIYHEGDEFDAAIWSREYLGTAPFHIVFSDALHDPAALLHEFRMLQSQGLLDPKNLAYCFDDLEYATDHPMWTAARSIFTELRAQNPCLQLTHYRVNAWLGQHEPPHNFGAIS